MAITTVRRCAILFANLFVQVAELIVNAIEIATGELPGAAAGGLLIHLVLGGLFGWALYKSRRVSLATAATAA